MTITLLTDYLEHSAGDIVTLPQIEAEKLIKEGKAKQEKYTPENYKNEMISEVKRG